MVPHACASSHFVVESYRCCHVIAWVVVVGEVVVVLLVEIEYVGNVIDHEIYMYIGVLMIFRVLDSIDELYFYYCWLWISPLQLENVALCMGNLQVIQNSRSGGSSVLRIWYVTGWEFVVVFSFLMYQFLIMLLEICLLLNKLLIINYVEAFLLASLVTFEC